MSSPVAPGPTLTAAARDLLARGKKNRIVVKIGSPIVVENNEFSANHVGELCQFVADISKKYEVILVTSGAGPLASTRVSLDRSTVPGYQALLAIGQPLLMHLYYTEFRKFGLHCAQLLLDSHDFDSRRRTANATNSMEVLLANKIIPIINENDATITPETSFGDNDLMAAQIAMHFNAHMLVVLCDTDGYHDVNPRMYPQAKVRPLVRNITIEELSLPIMGDPSQAAGGIVMKLGAAKLMMDNKRKMLLTNGRKLDKVRAHLLDGVQEIGTLFEAEEDADNDDFPFPTV